MKTSKSAYGAKAIIYLVNDFRRYDHGICLGDLIIEDGRHYLVVHWTRNTSTGEVLPAGKHELDPAKLQALRGGRAEFYYPDPIRLAESENPQ